MCGRYSLTTPVEALRQLFLFAEQPNLAPRSNIAPTQDVPAVRLGKQEPDSDAGDGEARQLVMLRWGLIPAWAKDRSIGNRMINARGESVADKPAFRSAFRKRRCLILADGFYEWRKEAGGKQPYRIALADGGPFAFAGLWERWTDREDGSRVETCTIITTTANARLKAIYDRMPVILALEDHTAWLDGDTTPEAAAALLRPFPADALTAYPVSKEVNKVANDDPDLVTPIGPPLEQSEASSDKESQEPRLL